MEILNPGVYVRELAGEDRSIKGVGTSTAAFVGVAEMGPVDQALMVSSFAEFKVNFGNFLSESWLAHSVLQFFNNGGTRLYIARVMGRGSTAIQEIDYQKAFTLLDSVADINLVAVPGIGSPSMVSFGSDYCQKRGDCFFIGDMSLCDSTKENAQTFIGNIDLKSSYAAVYFPWLKMKDPSGTSSETIAVPASGAVAGIYARIDARRGVWKAAAGGESNINGATGLLVNITDHEQNTINPIGVNVIRAFQSRGIIIWGARTLATRSDPEYKYVPVRRTAIYIKQSIDRGIQWAVFEPNDEALWTKVRLNVEAFMQSLFRQGAFQGSKSEKAYFVRCDRGTTTQSDVNQGIFNILVGFSPAKPAEFVVLKLSQKSGQK